MLCWMIHKIWSYTLQNSIKVTALPGALIYTNTWPSSVWSTEWLYLEEPESFHQPANFILQGKHHSCLSTFRSRFTFPISFIPFLFLVLPRTWSVQLQMDKEHHFRCKGHFPKLSLFTWREIFVRKITEWNPSRLNLKVNSFTWNENHKSKASVRDDCVRVQFLKKKRKGKAYESIGYRYNDTIRAMLSLVINKLSRDGQNYCKTTTCCDATVICRS